MSNHVNPNMSNREVADFTLVDFEDKAALAQRRFRQRYHNGNGGNPRACKRAAAAQRRACPSMASAPAP